MARRSAASVGEMLVCLLMVRSSWGALEGASKELVEFADRFRHGRFVVIQAMMRRPLDLEPLLRLRCLLVAGLAHEDRGGLCPDDEQHRPRRDVLDVRVVVEVHKAREIGEDEHAPRVVVLSSRGPVVLVGFLDNPRRTVRNPLRNAVVPSDAETARLRGALLTDFHEYGGSVVLRRRPPLSRRHLKIPEADASDGLRAQLGRCGRHDVRSSGADAEKSDAVFVHHREGREVVDGAADVLHTIGGVLRVPRVSATLALVTCVVRQRHVPLLGHLSRVDAGSLLLDATEGVGHRHGGVLLRLIEVGRSEQKSRHAVELVGEGNLRHLNGGACAHGHLLCRAGFTRFKVRVGDSRVEGWRRGYGPRRPHSRTPFASRKASIPYPPYSRPTPENLKPPQGASGSSIIPLITTRPARIWEATRRARCRSVPRTALCSPYLESLARRTASSSESYAMTQSTGPKISSCAMAMSLVALTNTVGFTKYPPSNPAG